MEATDYLNETESAARQIFEGLAYYRGVLDKDPRPTFVGKVDPERRDEQLAEWYEQNQEEIRQSLAAQREYLGNTFSQATLAGALLQIAYMGISMFSTNERVPENWQSSINNGSKPARFCIGRCVKGVEVGLLIFAGRNQYNHWDEGELRNPSKAIFDRLANHSSAYIDPAFDLSNEVLDTYSHNIVSVIGWVNYDDYLNDLTLLVSD